MTADWRTQGLRNLLSMSARTRSAELAPPVAALLAEAPGALAQPLRGITTDGSVRTGLFPWTRTGVSIQPIVDAGRAFLATLDAERRAALVFPLAASERRSWINVHPALLRHGLLLEDLAPAQRAAALELMRATLSARGFAQARDIMRINGLLVELTGRAQDFGEWPYFLSLFGDPSADAPWAWQLDGHHLNVNAAIVGDQLVFTPTFMGSEPCDVETGPLAGTHLFVSEERTGLALRRSLTAAQAAQAVILPSIRRADVPDQDPIHGRMLAGPFRDNAVIRPTGVRGDALSPAQRGLLAEVIAAFSGWGRDGHAALMQAAAEAHLGETHFAWLGGAGEGDPFSYRVQSPVVLIELDQHAGTIFDNRDPSRNHIHSIVRTPNGGDYGADLLRQHHERFAHVDGRHVPRVNP